LTNQERLYVHEIVQKIGHGLTSESISNRPYRCIVINCSQYNFNNETGEQKEDGSEKKKIFKFPRTHHILNLGGKCSRADQNGFTIVPHPPYSNYKEFILFSNYEGTGVTRDDLVIDEKDAIHHFVNQKNIFIDEKIDGANLGISIDSDWKIIFQNRSHIVHSTSHSQFKGLNNWLDAHRLELCKILVCRTNR
jgi:hypothetical protein